SQPPLIPTILRTLTSHALSTTGTSTSLNTPSHMNISLRQPFGLCAAIIPWNGPVVTLIQKAAAALITGNVLIVKSSGKTPR
ncbi:Aldedh-domain-containing protein, partial [Aspergillus ellipticus CBS 707.79]